MNYAPTEVNSEADIFRLNTLLDQITEKPFLSPMVAINAVRAALDFGGFLLPKLDVEVDIEGPKEIEVLSYMLSGHRLPAPALDCEYQYKIENTDLYFYFVMDRTDEGVYEVYAQIVTDDELDALTTDDVPQDLVDENPDLMDMDASGETAYLKQQRHTSKGGTKGIS